VKNSDYATIARAARIGKRFPEAAVTALKLSRDMRGIPVSSNRLATDGRKWKALCHERKLLADWLATYGDADGTRIFPTVEVISAAFDTWGRRTVFRRLADLRNLGVLHSEGLRGERGPRVRRLLPDVLHKPQAEVPDSQVPKCQIDEPKCQTIRGTQTVTRPSPDRHKEREECPPPPDAPLAPSPEGMEFALLLRGKILGNNPRAKITENQLVHWAGDADRMMRIDKRTPEEIYALLVWSQADSFWKTNILSMKKLREKFDQLTMHAKRKEESNRRGKRPGSDTTQDHLDRMRRNAQILGLDRT
jgi:hypothetical protein